MSGDQEEFSLEHTPQKRDERQTVKRMPVYHVELVRDRSVKFEIETPIDSVKTAAKIITQELAGADREKLICMWLNARHGLIGMEIVSIGTLTASLASCREIFKGAILANAAEILIAHNHPSGNPSPSNEDIRLTKRLVEAGRIIGIEVVDHLIVADEGRSYSFKAEGAI